MNSNSPCPKEKSGIGLKRFGGDVTFDWGVSFNAIYITGEEARWEALSVRLQHTQSQEMLFMVDAIAEVMAGDVIAGGAITGGAIAAGAITG